MFPIAVTLARILLGLVFFVYGVNGFLHFLALPQMGPSAAAFFGGLGAGAYFFPLLAATQAIAGAALLVGRFVPLALTVLAPILVNIFAVHLFLAPAGLPLAIVMNAVELFLAWSYRVAFLPLLQARHEVGSAATKLVSEGAHG
jgi:uncharacterized membrane protein YphA (DoxX/SURF4 family)